jgi:hypothetical protein
LSQNRHPDYRLHTVFVGCKAGGYRPIFTHAYGNLSVLSDSDRSVRSFGI